MKRLKKKNVKCGKMVAKIDKKEKRRNSAG
jgi:hypothetical protein